MHRLISLGIVGLLGGCALSSSEDPVLQGMGKQSITEINARVEGGELESRLSPPVRPRSPQNGREETIHVWIPPHRDEEGNRYAEQRMELRLWDLQLPLGE
jgi:hypothetical protein